MNQQSSVIVASLVLAFIVFITMRGELRTYLGFFFGGGTPAQAPAQAPATPPSANTPTKQSSADTTSQIAQAALEVAPFLI